MSAIEKLAQARSAADVQGADSLWRVELVTGDGEQIHLECIYVNRNFARGLHGVGVKADVSCLGDAADFFERLDGAELVVGVHDGDKNSFLPDGAAQLLQFHLPFAIGRQIGDTNAFFFESLAGVEDSFVFDSGGDDVGRRIGLS